MLQGSKSQAMSPNSYCSLFLPSSSLTPQQLLPPWAWSQPFCPPAILPVVIPSLPSACISSQNGRVRLVPGCTSKRSMLGRTLPGPLWLRSASSLAEWPVQFFFPPFWLCAWTISMPSSISCCTWRLECVLAESQVFPRHMTLSKGAAPHVIEINLLLVLPSVQLFLEAGLRPRGTVCHPCFF